MSDGRASTSRVRGYVMDPPHRTCRAFGNERAMPPKIVRHCGRHMQFWWAPLLFWCPMCGTFIPLEQVDQEARDA